MSIIIQAGHYSSYSGRLMEELYIRGLERPSRSLSYNLSANEITHRLVEILSKESKTKLNYKTADNIIIDFQLGNVAERKVLGWEDEKNIAILEYLKDIELEAKFLLVFDHPAYMFRNINFENLNISSMDHMVNEWLLYHKSIISFYEENKSICLLIEGKASFLKFNNFRNALSVLKPDISLKSNWQIAERRKERKENDLDIPVDLLANLLFRNYPEIIQIYNKMLDLAELKDSQPIYKSTMLSKQELISSLKIVGSKITDSNNDLIKENKELQQKLDEACKLIESKQKIIDGELVSKKNIDTEYSSNLKLKNRKLIFQLTEAYEKIESYSNESSQEPYSKLDKNTSLQKYPKSKPKISLKVAEEKPEKNVILYGAENRIKEDLPYRLGAIIVSSNRSLKGRVLLPLNLLNEYEQYKKNKIEELPPLEEYADKAKGEKVKSQLSYQIGKRIVDVSSSPQALVRAPFGIVKDIYNFKKNKKDE